MTDRKSGVDLVNLANMAERLNQTFARHLETPISNLTPYDWWKRTKSGAISDPLPKPIIFLAGRPMFRYSDVMRWFIGYRGIGGKK